ncbi:MAG: glycoside hydrolase N-terminal domain-containing protein [Tannerella sp.]|jgi:hypothetical protein|nr:glycoside hydrolase N-terminal domain-containing protein [Tannerella sp.]
MKRKNLFKAIVAILSLQAASLSTLFAQEVFSVPACGFISERPARNWEHSLLSGNGTMGIMIPGEPYSESVIVSHSLLYLPLKASGATFLQGEKMPEIQSLALAGEYGKAGLVIDQLRKEAGYVDDRDPFISGFHIRIEQETGETARYRRSVDYETGETFTDWENEKGRFRRSAFVSRPDSVIVIRLTGTAPLNAVIGFAETPTGNSREKKMQEEHFTETGAGLSGQWMTFRAMYKYANPYNTLRGYEAAGKVVNKGGSLVYAGNKVIARDVDELIILARIEVIPEKAETVLPRLKDFLNARPSDYQRLLSSHAAVHGDLFRRVKLDLHADASDRALPVEELIAKSQTDTPPFAMIEKAFNAGRYNIISCTGTNPPNLQGLWSGTWSAPWSGSFTTNGNLPTAIAFYLAGNTPSLIHAYFDWNERMMDGFRLSAKELFNCRGIHIPGQITTNWRVTDTSKTWPHSYWTGSAAWTAQAYFDYYQHTGDRQFLRERAFPLMKEAALFYEDFLKIEKDGKYVFVPSYSPENEPSTTGVATAVNATTDVMACKQLLRNCIQAATLLNENKDKIKTWKAILDKMPDYEISKEGALREWLWPGLEENYPHRHASHLYALFNEIPVEFKNSPELKKAVETAIDYRIKFFKEGGGGMAFGLTHAGWAASHIGSKRQTADILDFLTKNYWSTGMGSFHDVQHLFNMDISGGYPYLVSQCLAYSEPGYLKLLPACPDRWEKGCMEGLLLRGNVILQKLDWNKDRVEITLLASRAGNIRVELDGKVRTVKLNKNASVKYTFRR